MSATDFVVRGPSDIGRAIQHTRTKVGLSQEDLARLSDVDRTYVAKIENGRSSRLLTLVFDILRDLDLEMTLHTRTSDDRGD